MSSLGSKETDVADLFKDFLKQLALNSPSGRKSILVTEEQNELSGCGTRNASRLSGRLK